MFWIKINALGIKLAKKQQQGNASWFLLTYSPCTNRLIDHHFPRKSLNIFGNQDNNSKICFITGYSKGSTTWQVTRCHRYILMLTKKLVYKIWICNLDITRGTISEQAHSSLIPCCIFRKLAQCQITQYPGTCYLTVHIDSQLLQIHNKLFLLQRTLTD